MQWSYTVETILSYSILIAGIIGIIKFGDIRSIYRPFIYLIWIGCAAELLGDYFAYVYRNNIMVGTIYRLCESLFLLWFFTRLNLFRNRKFLYLLVAIFVLIWIAENFFITHFNRRLTYYFDIIYAFTVVLLSITAINDLLFTERELLKNPTFLICTGLVIYFTYKIIQRMFDLYGLKESVEFRLGVTHILSLINCLTNLIFAAAVLFMRKRQPFSLRF